MTIKVRLERIGDNPFQTRQVYDETGIEELAADIRGLRSARAETMGLIQVPLGRLVVFLGEDDGAARVLDPGEFGGVEAALEAMPTAVVELAAGHRRLRAFRHLESIEGGDGFYEMMPVDVGVLSDQAMADIAWSENAKRSDLSAVEEGAAIKRAQEEFGYSLAVVSQRWGLSRSAASNKVRLLELPCSLRRSQQGRIRPLRFRRPPARVRDPGSLWLHVSK